jgi:NADH-quinone oxidoreductase subunit M
LWNCIGLDLGFDTERAMSDILAASGVHKIGTDFPILTFIVLIPFIGGALIGLVSLWDSRDRTARVIGGVASVLTLVCTVLLLIAFDRKDGDFQFVSAHQWIKDFGIQWKLGVDGISLFLIVLTGIIFPIALFGARVNSNVKAFIAWMLVLEGGCLGSFVSLDLFLFFVFFEVVLVPMYFLIAGWGQARRRYAAIKFFLYTLAGSAFLFVGMLALVFITAVHTHSNPTFDLVTLQQQHAFSNSEARWLFIAFAIAFAVKVPIFPLHTWIGDTYEQSPIGGVVISAAVMVKLGTYGLIRFGLFLFPKAAHDMAPLLLTLAVIGMIYGGVVAAVQKDLRRLAAYSSLSHLGFIVLGTFAFTSQGLSGAVLQMINHGVTAAAMFLLIGMIYSRRDTTFIADLKGLQGPAPVLAGIFTVVVMSSIGVPGLNGFIGEFMVLVGTFVTHRWWAVVGTSAVVIAAIYLLWAYQRVFHGEADEATRAKMFDLTARERWVMAPLVVLIVFLGIYPRPVLDRIEPSVDRILVQTPNYHPGKPVAPADDSTNFVAVGQ